MKFYVAANNARRFGVNSGGYNERGTVYHVNLRNGEMISLLIDAPLEQENPCFTRNYQVELRQ